MTAVEQQTLSFVEAAGGNHRQKLVEDTKVAAICEKNDGVLRSVRPNILGNALAYGAAAKPVRLIAETVGDRFKLSVSNAGDTIPAATLQRCSCRSRVEQSDQTSKGWDWGVISLQRSQEPTAARSLSNPEMPRRRSPFGCQAGQWPRLASLESTSYVGKPRRRCRERHCLPATISANP